jgi:hypothetical protein
MLQWSSKLLCILFLLSSCSNRIEDVDAITKKYDITKDVGENVKIIYSDSAVVKLTIDAPVMER